MKERFSLSRGDVYLIKTDENGNEQWSKTFGGSEFDAGYSVQQVADGGFIIAGLTESYGAGEGDVYLIKTDESGNELWSKTFGGVGNDSGYSVNQVADKGLIIAGWTSSFGAGFSDVYLTYYKPPDCKSDFNDDGKVDNDDLELFSIAMGESDCTSRPALCDYDIEGDDSDIDGADLSVLASEFGWDNCP